MVDLIEDLKKEQEKGQERINSLNEIKGIITEMNEEETIEAFEKIRQCYYFIKETLERYIVMKEEYYPIISLWIIGTYFHDEFSSYPYLFFNAMRGSGKTKSLNLITNLSKDGLVMISPTEAVLFRTHGTLGIDEFESVGSKEKSAIRELLNACYKKGIKILRMKKKKILGQEEQVVEEFEPYRPIVMANIWGMDEVLGDRCINLILEKSDDPYRTKLIEEFDSDENIQFIKKTLSSASKCRLCRVKNIYNSTLGRLWNDYVKEKSENIMTLKTLDTQTTQTTQTTLNTTQEETPEFLEARKKAYQKLTEFNFDSFFNKINDSGIYGRNLELWFSLFFISYVIDKDFLVPRILEIAKILVNQKEEEEESTSRDVILYDLVSTLQNFQFYSVKWLTDEFRTFADEYDKAEINEKWMGRALRRLELIIDKKRVANGRQVVLNISKAKEKIKMFKSKNNNSITTVHIKGTIIVDEQKKESEENKDETEKTN